MLPNDGPIFKNFIKTSLVKLQNFRQVQKLDDEFSQTFHWKPISIPQRNEPFSYNAFEVLAQLRDISCIFWYCGRKLKKS